MKRSEILDAARKCVCGEREKEYGSPENNFHTIALLWTVYLRDRLKADIRPEDVAAMLALLKIASIASGNAKEDNWIDLAGYAACGGEIETAREGKTGLNSKGLACQEATKRVMARTMDVEGPGVPGVIYTCDNRPCKAKRNAVGAYILRKEIANG